MKNKTLLFIISTFILPFYSCHSDLLDSVFKDYRYDILIQNTDQLNYDSMYLNYPVPFKIVLNKYTPGIGNYNFFYEQSSGKGMLYYKDSLLKPGEFISFEGQQMSLAYVPTSLNKHLLSFTFDNNVVKVSKTFTCSVAGNYLEIVPENIPEAIYINVPSRFNLIVKKTYADNEDNKFETKMKIINGSGTVKIINSANNDEKSGSYLVSGINEIVYTPESWGVNILRFEISNEYHFSQVIEIPLNVLLPEYSTHIICDSIAELGSSKHFILSVNDNIAQEDNRYILSYRPIINSGTLRINTQKLEAGSSVQIQKGENIGEYIPSTEGKAILEFIVKDKYNTISKDSLILSVVKSDIQIDVSNYTPNVTVNDKQDFNLAVSKNNYHDNFQLEIIPTPVHSCKLIINNQEYSGGRIHISQPENIKISYIPQQVGTTQLKMKVYDNYNNTSEKVLDFSVENSAGFITISNYTPLVNIYSRTNFNFSIQKPNYQKGFQFEIYSTPPASAQFLINGQSYNGGRIDVSNPNNTLVTFIPERLGTIMADIVVYDEFSGMIKKQLQYEVRNTPISLNISNVENNLIVNQPTHFNLSVKKEDYSDERKIVYSIKPSTGITINNKVYDGSEVEIPYKDIAKGIPICYCPQESGEKILTITVKDDHAQQKQQVVTYQVTEPELLITLTGVDKTKSNVAYINEPFKFSINVEKQYYMDDFAYWINLLPGDVGTVTAQDISPALQSKADNAGNSVTGTIKHTDFGMSIVEVSFIPQNTIYLDKEVTLQFRVRDKRGNEKSQLIHFTITTSDIIINTFQSHTSIPVASAETFYFTVDKANYTGSFKYSLTGYNEKVKVEISDQIDGIYAEYKGGKFALPNTDHTFVRLTPFESGDLSLKLTIYDDNNYSVEKWIYFEAIPPKVQLNGSAIKEGQTEEYIDFTLTAVDEYNGSLNASFDVSPELDGIVLFNKENIYGPAITKAIPIKTIQSGANNNLKMMSRKLGTYSTHTTIRNLYNQTASAVNTIHITKLTTYLLAVSHTGEGNVKIIPAKEEYLPGETVQLVAEPAEGWTFKTWEGNINSTDKIQFITMTSDKVIKAVFEKDQEEFTPIIFKIASSVTPPTKRTIANLSIVISDALTEKTIFSSNIIYPVYSEYSTKVRLNKTKIYNIQIVLKAVSFKEPSYPYGEYIPEQLNFNMSFADGSRKVDSSHISPFKKDFTVKGSSFFGSQTTILTGYIRYEI